MGAQLLRTPRMSADERREQLLDATKAIVARDGFHAVSIEAVAREAGVSRPIVYGHFDARPGLLEALVDREGARALGQLAEVLPRDLTSGDPRENLLAGLRGYLAAAEADPVTWRLVLMPPGGPPAVLRERVTAGRAAVLAQLAEAIGGGFGPSVSPDPELTARMLSTLADESARLVLPARELFSPERVIEPSRWARGLLAPRS